VGIDPQVSPPVLPGFSWRPLAPSDTPAFHALQTACASFDHLPAPQTLEELRGRLEQAALALHTDSLCAVGADGELAAVAWVTLDDSYPHELRAVLTGWVRPAYRGRGVGRCLIEWMEVRAAEKFADWQDDRPRVLRLDVEHQDEQIFRLYREMGYHLAVAEETMRRSLSGPLPKYALPAGMRVFPWSPEWGEHFHQTYLAAFRDRPGFPAWDLETWRAVYTGLTGFRPDLSLLVLDGAVGAAYAVCVTEEDTGWIVQMGVNADFRRRGLGAGLLAELLRRFRAEGMAQAALDVNLNNQRARRLYDRLGFVSVSVCSSFRKIL